MEKLPWLLSLTNTNSCLSPDPAKATNSPRAFSTMALSVIVGPPLSAVGGVIYFAAILVKTSGAAVTKHRLVCAERKFTGAEFRFFATTSKSAASVLGISTGHSGRHRKARSGGQAG